MKLLSALFAILFLSNAFSLKAGAQTTNSNVHPLLINIIDLNNIEQLHKLYLENNIQLEMEYGGYGGNGAQNQYH